MIKAAIIGAGIGRDHYAGYRALPERFEVRAFCDLDEARARAVVGDDGVAVTADVQSVIDDPEIDVIDICLPPFLHFSAAKAALEAGKHVICEKPLVSSMKEADTLLRLAGQTGRMLTPVFQYRYGLAMAQLNALRAAGLIGKAFAASMETHWNRGADYYAVDWRGTWAGENGGAILGHAIHNHDLLTVLLGPVSRVAATLATRVNDIEVEDCAAISFVMESGAVATSSVTLGAGLDTSRIRVCFDGVTAESGTEPYSPMTDRWRFFARDPVRQDDVDAVLATVEEPKSGFSGFLAAFADKLERDDGEAVKAEEGRRSIELVTAIYQAARSEQWVQLPLDKTSALYAGWGSSEPS
ncbi:Gfo/Idh/MocA family oxidoreductase [uncultured Martelella sp.]|uniref:Gfo/Idh/MocA family protein n=1 Tax=uncultured Martelella sp. TaxID=392331 RepID=UPI0029C61847|nr:Gfo/Idh/MocA family oxidoreductase [uncultured Martelella sp.]